MTQNKKQSMQEISSTLGKVITAHMAGKPVFKEMAKRIETRRDQGIDRLIAVHVPEEDDLTDFIDELEFQG